MEPQIKKKIWMIGSIVLVLAFITTMPWLLPPKPPPVAEDRVILEEPDSQDTVMIKDTQTQTKKERVLANIKIIPFDFTEPLVVAQTPPDTGQKYDQMTITDHLYRRKIILKTTGFPTPLRNFPVCIDLDTQQWIQEAKLSMINENLYFTDQDGTTPLPFYIAHGYGKKATRIWLNIPELPAWTTQKAIYCYYSRSSDYPEFKQIPAFPLQENYYGWYVLDELRDKHIADLSGNLNPAELILSSYEYSWGMFHFHENKKYLFFNDYQKWWNSDINEGVYVTVPGKKLQALSQKGAVEFWFKPYYISESITQHFMTDTSEQIMIGLLPDRSIFFQLGSPQNRIVWDSATHQGNWYHLLLSWDLTAKQTKLFIYGKEVPVASGLSSFSWTPPAALGDLFFGGYYVESSSYGFSGYMDGLRLHREALTLDQAYHSYKHNHFRYYFPSFEMEKEEIAQSNKKDQLFLDFAKVKDLPVNEMVAINTIYALPIHYNDSYFGEIYTGKEDLINIVHNPENYQQVFGMSSHFYSYVGTEVSFQDSYLLQYLGLKINDPKLIADMKISFYWLVDHTHPYYPYRYGSPPWMGKVLAWLMPRAYACGPYYSYKALGESSLKLLGIVEGTCWYKLDKPFFVNPLATIMQLDYLPSTQRGALHIKMEDLIFLDNAKQFHRAKLHQSAPEILYKRERIDEKDYQHFNSEYIAHHFPMEKGSIELIVSEQNELALALRNIGTDPIEFDYFSRYYFQENVFTHLLVLGQKNQIILEINLRDFNRHPIPVGHYLYMPLLFEDDLGKSDEFRVKLLRKDSLNLRVYDDEQKKIISWTLDNKPFEYFRVNQEGMIWKKIHKDTHGHLLISE